jgi:hypothetical protein
MPNIARLTAVTMPGGFRLADEYPVPPALMAHFKQAGIEGPAGPGGTLTDGQIDKLVAGKTLEQRFELKKMLADSALLRRVSAESGERVVQVPAAVLPLLRQAGIKPPPVGMLSGVEVDKRLASVNMGISDRIAVKNALQVVGLLAR